MKSRILSSGIFAGLAVFAIACGGSGGSAPSTSGQNQESTESSPTDPTGVWVSPSDPSSGTVGETLTLRTPANSSTPGGIFSDEVATSDASNPARIFGQYTTGASSSGLPTLNLRDTLGNPILDASGNPTSFSYSISSPTMNLSEPSAINGGSLHLQFAQLGAASGNPFAGGGSYGCAAAILGPVSVSGVPQNAPFLWTHEVLQGGAVLGPFDPSNFASAVSQGWCQISSRAPGTTLTLTDPSGNSQTYSWSSDS